MIMGLPFSFFLFFFRCFVSDGMQDYLIREGLVLVPGADDGRDASAGVSRSTATHATGSGAAATATPASATTAAHPQQQQPQQPPQQENANTAGTAGSGQDMGAKPLRKRARKAFHRSSAAEVFLEQQQQQAQQQQQQAACDDADMANDDADGSAYGAACGAGGGFGAGPRLARESWFQPKWVPGPLFAVRDVLGAFPATQPASEHENPALVRAEADPRFDLEDLRALSYDEYVETVISSVLVCHSFFLRYFFASFFRFHFAHLPRLAHRRVERHASRSATSTSGRV